ncbi:hypothetical protein E2562_018108 [Oryza meyeriana var. granulata]|uniref:Uncharacterized protein n=1 Tax=Oryza meyeriana var. granulata TaxID=110450 RepID=A0A6G1CQ64_9ORYZ|nr:hypothetical protein E2562_018108 [Oryza meyeriana var. granulata]
MSAFRSGPVKYSPGSMAGGGSPAPSGRRIPGAGGGDGKRRGCAVPSAPSSSPPAYRTQRRGPSYGRNGGWKNWSSVGGYTALTRGTGRSISWRKRPKQRGQ